MNRRLLIACALVICGVSVAAGQASRPGTDAAGEPKTLPRTPWGHPDLQGRWTNATITPLERPAELAGKEFLTDAEAAEYQKGALKRFLESAGLVEEAAISGEFVEGVWMDERTLVTTKRSSLIVGPEGRIPPLTPDGQKRAAARGAARKLDRADSFEDRNMQERCLWFPVGGPPMMPGVAYNSNYEIVQTPTHVAILAEMGYSFRIIPLDGRPHIDGRLRNWHGDSRGRWEGDTLVVETTNFNEKPAFRGASEEVRIVERFRRVANDQILYQFTIDDPKTWTKSWTVEIPWRPMKDLIYEFACHEGNYGLVNILKGARASEGAPR
jgi:hypothetical protein